jgi:hypothetical protein
MSDSPVSPEDIRAAAAAYAELGPEYHDAVVASFLEKVDREVAARVEARLAGIPAPQPPAPRTRRGLALTRRRVRDLAAAGAGALAVIGAVAVHHGSVSGAASAQVRVAKPGPPQGQVFKRAGPRGKTIIVGPPAPPAPPAAPKG